IALDLALAATLPAIAEHLLALRAVGDGAGAIDRQLRTGIAGKPRRHDDSRERQSKPCHAVLLRLGAAPQRGAGAVSVSPAVNHARRRTRSIATGSTNGITVRSKANLTC